MSRVIDEGEKNLERVEEEIAFYLHPWDQLYWQSLLLDLFSLKFLPGNDTHQKHEVAAQV